MLFGCYLIATAIALQSTEH